jgi:predicted RNA-binding Zn-ribbon protein involved in translation (DUF1610 family)
MPARTNLVGKRTRTTTTTPRVTIIIPGKTMTRFRCAHCGNRLVMQNRHLRRLVACHACGRATHPAMKRQIASLVPVPAPQPPAVQAAVPSSPAPAQPAPVANPRPATPGLELSIAPLAPLIVLGATGGAFFAAISLMSYLGGFASALMLVATAAVAVRWLKRGTLSVRARLGQIDETRARVGSFRVAAMLLAWLWAQPAARKPWACLLMVFWGALYAPYRMGGLLMPVPRREARLVRVAA